MKKESENEKIKRQLEKAILERAHSLLEKLYGPYKVDDSQTDRPDAAIDIASPRKQVARDRKPIKVGIEITTVDPSNYLSYVNDEKHGQGLVAAEVEALTKNGVISKNPNKRMEVPITSDFIYSRIKNKAKLYESYKSAGVYKEVVLLCYTKILLPEFRYLEELIEWSNYYMGINDYPFDKVIFLADLSCSAIKIYDRKNPLRKQAPLRKWHNPSVSVTLSPAFPMDTPINIYDHILNEPLIKPKSKKKP